METKAKKGMKKLLAGTLVTVFLFASVSYVGLSRVNAKKTASEQDKLISLLEDELADATAKRKKAKSAYDKINKQYSSLKEKKLAIDAEIESIENEADKLRQIVDAYGANSEKIAADISDRQDELNEMLEVLRDRLRVSYEDGTEDYYSIFFESDGLYEFLTAVDRLSFVMDHDRKLMSEYENAYNDLLLQQKELDESVANAEEKSAELTASLGELSEKRAEMEKMIKDLEKNTDEAQKVREEAEKEVAEFRAELEKRLKEREDLEGGKYTGGAFVWPLPSKYKKISSSFGNRIHPITNKPQFHEGVDIPAPYKTEIHSVAKGVVTETGSHYGNGNYVIVDHGGGISTMYAHLSKICVSKGDILEKDELLGLVGMTGYATGYHLHLSVYEHGKAVDPMKYYGK